MTDRFAAADEAAARHLAAACHEMRTPVAVLTLVAGLGEQLDRLEPDTVRTLLARLRSETARLRVLVDRYLESGRATYVVEDEPERLDVATVTADVARGLDPVVPVDRVRLELEPAWTTVDRHRLHTIVENLIANAAQFSPGGEAVEVRTAVRGHDVELSVLDCGIGIPGDERASVLEPFRTGSNARRLRLEGVGLGLTLTAVHVEALGGTLTIEDGAGGGTVVTVRIPGEAPGRDPAAT